MPELVIGCPIRRREWMVPSWVQHVARACDVALLKPDFVFVVPKDDPTKELLSTHIQGVSRLSTIGLGNVEFIRTDEETTELPRQGNGGWSSMRYQRMVDLRNGLLRRVRQVGPKYFLSLDSDILLAPEALQEALVALESVPADAVGMRTYMFPGSENTMAPSHGQIVHGRLRNRHDWRGQPIRVDAIMAAKLMTAPAYNIDYEMHTEGEDIGWSAACGRAGVRLAYCSTAIGKHIMAKGDLDVVDERVGF